MNEHKHFFNEHKHVRSPLVLVPYKSYCPIREGNTQLTLSVNHGLRGKLRARFFTYQLLKNHTYIDKIIDIIATYRQNVPIVF